MRIAVIGDSGSGKTTLAGRLAAIHGIPHVELDGLHHLAGWQPAPDFEAKVAARVSEPGWVIDGNYTGRLGLTVIKAADVVVWLDLPLRVTVPRTVVRTLRRIRSREALWNGNRETFRGAFLEKDGLVAWTLKHHGRRRREWPLWLEGTTLVRLRSPGQVRQWLEEQERSIPKPPPAP